jgi:hypothetical protein
VRTCLTTGLQPSVQLLSTYCGQFEHWWSDCAFLV